MRSLVNIIWLEDNIQDRPHKSRKASVEDYISSKGYQPHIEEVTTLNKARELLSFRGGEQRYDFFISDFDLGGGTDAEKGLDYLVEVRKFNNYKRFFILYSRNEYKTISDKILLRFQEEKNINLFTNFSFISLSSGNPDSIHKEFNDSIDTALCRWDELNAIRGLYMCEHAELEQKLKDKGYCNEYESNIALFCQKEKVSEEIKIMWDGQRKIRNALAHVKEVFDHRRRSFYIQSNQDDRVKIYENQLDQHRKDLLKLKQSLRDIL